MLYDRHCFELAKLVDAIDYRGLDGVRFEEDGAVVVTNGTHLVRYKPHMPATDEFPKVEGMALADNKDTLVPFTLPKAAALKVAKQIPRKTTLSILGYACLDVAGTNAGDKVRLAVTDSDTSQVICTPKGEDKYPEWRKVLPTEDTIDANASLCPTLLATLASTARSLGCICLKVELHGADKPAKFTGKTENGGEVMMVLMPRRA